MILLQDKILRCDDAAEIQSETELKLSLETTQYETAGRSGAK